MKKSYIFVIVFLWVFGFLTGIWGTVFVEDKWITQFALWKMHMQNIVSEEILKDWKFYGYLLGRQLIKTSVFTVLILAAKKRMIYVLVFLDSCFCGYLIGLWIGVDGVETLGSMAVITGYKFLLGILSWNVLLKLYERLFLKKHRTDMLWKTRISFCIMTTGLWFAVILLETIFTFIIFQVF